MPLGAPLMRPSQIPKVNKRHLASIIHQLESRFPDSSDDVFLAYGLACELIRFFLGHDWTNSNVFQQAARNQSEGANFLKTRAANHDDRFRHQDRVVRLAELLFNLQGIEGFQDRLGLIRTGNLEAAYAELQCASHIARSSVEFRFVVPSGTRGLDFDAEILPHQAPPIPVELKSKAEETDLSSNTILSTLQAARRQLPPSTASLAFLKIPEHWVRDPAIAPEVTSALEEFFRNTSRVIAVVFRWEEWYFSPTGHGLILSKFRVEINPSSHHISSPVMEVLDMMRRPYSRAWTDLLSLATSAAVRR